MKKITYQEKEFEILDENSLEIKLKDLENPSIEIVISKDSKRYKAIMGKDVIIDKPSKIHFFVTDDFDNDSYSDADYYSEKYLDELYVILTENRGKHSIKELIKAYCKTNADKIEIVKIWLAIISKKAELQTIYGEAEFEKIQQKVLRGSVECKGNSYDDFSFILDEIVDSENPNDEQKISLVESLPNEAKFHLTTALCDMFADNYKISSSDCREILESLE